MLIRSVLQTVRILPLRSLTFGKLILTLLRGVRPVYFPIEDFHLNYPRSRHLSLMFLRSPRTAFSVLKSYDQMVARPLQENLARRVAAALLEAANEREPAVIDAGGWIGDNALPWARLLSEVGQVVMVEPSRRNLDSVQELAKLNKLENIVLFPGVLASGDGLEFNPLGSIHHGEFVLASGSSSRLKKVPSISIDSLTTRLGICPLLIHLDVEGMELDVLRGATHSLESAKPSIIFEWHIARQDFFPVFELLDASGYRLFLINEIPPHCAPDTRNFLAIPSHREPPTVAANLIPHEGAEDNWFPLILGPALLPVFDGELPQPA